MRIALGIFLIILMSFISGLLLGQKIELFPSDQLLSPLVKQIKKPKELPLLKYSFNNLPEYQFQASELKIEKTLEETADYTSYLFSYTTTEQKMTGVVNVPSQALDANQPLPVVILIRGWVPAASYYPGLGSKNAAAVFAKNGYVTFAPDFFGYGQSDPEPSNSWEARFIKPINVIELIYTIQNQRKLTLPNQPMKKPDSQHLALAPDKLKIWAHSNGGQIALSVLEILSQPIPTTLWAPVTAPFPYSVLFFSDEHDDEGKEMRKWLSLLEADYDVFEFSITQHLDKLNAPLQIHHGTADEAALKTWSDEFVSKLKKENQRRQQTKQALLSTDSAQLNTQILAPIKINYYSYAGANHNLQPNNNWDLAIQRDLKFFSQY
ncbi:MAG: hypothetical protein GF390_03725 [Candidatus Pacebacteria bacterium]|nr:hypothetical protein [Candidatus Paceibacterota bacterium]